MIEQVKEDIANLEALFTPEQLQHIKALRALYETLNMLEQFNQQNGI